MRLGLFFGGRSSEYEISLRSLIYVHECLSELDDIEIDLIGISREGKFYLYGGPLEAIADDTWLEEDITPIYWRLDPSEPGFFTESFTTYKFHPLDIAFPCLHGEYGEDGTIQGLFEMMHLPYVGSGVLGSAIALDKAVSRNVFDKIGIPQAKWLWLRERRYAGDREGFQGHQGLEVPFPEIRVERVDADDDFVVAVVEVGERLFHEVAGGVLLVGRDRVFEVENQGVGRQHRAVHQHAGRVAGQK